MKREYCLLMLFLSSTLACNAVSRIMESASAGNTSGAGPAGASGAPASGQILLNEIRFATEEGQPQFIELKNAGSSGAGLAGLELSNEATQTYRLPDSTPRLAPGEFFLIVLDGQATIDGLTLHADRTDFLNPTTGWVALRGKDGTPLDHVAWGDEQLGPVKLSVGGVVEDPEPGMTIGRFPLAVRTDPEEWVPFSADQATLGAANPVPAVQILLPLSGALIAPGEVTLGWYPVAGAAQYTVQVSHDGAFASLELSQTVAAPPLEPDSLPAGTYYWRVQAVDAAGSPSEFSPINLITVEAPGSSGSLHAPAREELLPVPFLFQKKDSPMLLLESKNETGDHAWDRAHPGFDWDDPADNSNCALASIAMVNHAYGGDLTQDRIGYYILKGGGPERDLMYSRGLYLDEITRALEYAVGARPTIREEQTVDTMWNEVTAEIDAGRPVVAYVPGHAFVIIGYDEKDGKRFFSIHDPSIGTYDVDRGNPEQSDLRKKWDTYWLIPPQAPGKKEDAGVFEDSDADGVVNIDESERFKTNPNLVDTDQDGVNDKQDIISGVFDPGYGYAFHLDSKGRDFDDDEKPTELDEDSDNAGCLDGMEDTNGNGKYDPEIPDETYNFETADDVCIKGSSEVNVDFSCQSIVPSTITIHGSSHNRGVFSFRATEDGRVDGTATVTATDAVVSVEGMPTCGTVEFHSLKPLQWKAKLTGTYKRLPDGSIEVSVQVAPEYGPSEGMVSDSICSIYLSELPFQPTYWTILSGRLVNGRFDDRVAVVLPFNCTGETSIIKTHMEASAGFK